MSEKQVSLQSQKEQCPAAERPSAHLDNHTALPALSLVELILPWWHPMYYPSSSALFPHFLCYSVKKSYNCTAVIWWRDGWEQQNHIRSSKHSSDCLLEMEMRSPWFFWDAWLLQEKAYCKLIFSVVGHRAIARQGGLLLTKQWEI